ncbi:MAG TPA: PilZ domain-containing protein [Burkholderiales bacterium]|nr:PilZ domain-containing protein [Burkholderiales bacterium]
MRRRGRYPKFAQKHRSVTRLRTHSAGNKHQQDCAVRGTVTRKETSDGTHRARGFDLRREERIETALPVHFETGATGVTRNVSSAGFYVETDDRLPLGEPLGFTIDFGDQPGGPLRVSASAKILRVEDRGGRWGVAAAIQWPAP